MRVDAEALIIDVQFDGAFADFVEEEISLVVGLFVALKSSANDHHVPSVRLAGGGADHVGTRPGLQHDAADRLAVRVENLPAEVLIGQRKHNARKLDAVGVPGRHLAARDVRAVAFGGEIKLVTVRLRQAGNFETALGIGPDDSMFFAPTLRPLLTTNAFATALVMGRPPASTTPAERVTVGFRIKSRLVVSSSMTWSAAKLPSALLAVRKYHVIAHHVR